MKPEGKKSHMLDGLHFVPKTNKKRKKLLFTAMQEEDH